MIVGQVFKLLGNFYKMIAIMIVGIMIVHSSVKNKFKMIVEMIVHFKI